MNHPIDDHIRRRAHQLWELAGRPEGRDRQFWIEAERELKESAETKGGDGTINADEKSTTFTE